MIPVFLFGTLCHAPLRQAVLGHDVALKQALLPGWRAVHPGGPGGAGLAAAAGAQLAGFLVDGLDAGAQARLAFHAAVAGLVPQRVQVTCGGRHLTAGALVPEGTAAGTPWDAPRWQADWGGIVAAAAADAMALFGQADPAALRARQPAMLARADSRLRARGAAPTALRRQARPEDVQITARRQPYAAFFAVEEYDLAFRRFDGGFSDVVTRAVFLSGDAVTVLPYDPQRDRVLLVEQFRSGVLARGDPQPWMLEAIAGRIDPGETPEDAARREAREEASLELGPLHPLGAHYPSPAALSECIHSYVALTDLPDRGPSVFGLAEEAEDIRSHLVGFEALMALVTSGEIANGPLLIAALWLARERERLRS